MAMALLTGAILGWSVAAPFGPVSLMCVQNSLNRGLIYGAAGGLGAATAHGIFATAAVAGAGVAAAVLSPWAAAIHVASALVLIGLGVRTIVRAASVSASMDNVSLRAAYGSLLLLSLSNPMTILPYLAVATAVTGASQQGPALSLWSVPGVMLAAASWYAGISLVTGIIRRRLSFPVAAILNRVAGVALVSFGVIIGLHSLRAI